MYGTTCTLGTLRTYVGIWSIQVHKVYMALENGAKYPHGKSLEICWFPDYM